MERPLSTKASIQYIRKPFLFEALAPCHPTFGPVGILSRDKTNACRVHRSIDEARYCSKLKEGCSSGTSGSSIFLQSGARGMDT